jgi:hypothetical protein
MTGRTFGIALLAAIGLSACGGDTPSAVPGRTSPTPLSASSSSNPITTTPPVTLTTQPAKDATASAKEIRRQVASVVKVVTITEDNDPNNKIGRPGGYTSAAVIYEKSLTCTDLGAECGATIEVYVSEVEAKARAAYIQKAMKDMPILGNEYDYISAGALLRVAGEVKPSLAKKYNAAFGGTLFP